jgi:hypothetical protein
MLPLLIPLAALGMAVASSTEDKPVVKSTGSLLEIFDIHTWNVAFSHDWDPLSMSFLASGSTGAAWAVFEAESSRAFGIDSDDYDRVNVYAMIRGGSMVLQDSEDVLPDGVVVHVVWQAEQSVDVPSIVTTGSMTVQDAIRAAWAFVPQESDCRIYAEQSGLDEHSPFQPDMVVVGGDVMYIGLT